MFSTPYTEMQNVLFLLRFSGAYGRFQREQDVTAATSCSRSLQFCWLSKMFVFKVIKLPEFAKHV